MTRAAAIRGDEHAKLFERLFDEGSTMGLTEAQLVERFAANRDESAFAALVGRHGPMVLGVCRRFLRDPNDVDDAFQAVFLVLARKAAGLREKELLANWLYGVACRVAVRSRTTAARRAVSDAGDRLENDARKPTSDPPAESLARREDEARLHEEVGRLPTRYRAPVVACYFEGKTHEEAAASLGCPVGTVKGRLARARDLLRRRLERRGVVAPAALVTATLAAADVRAAVPPALAAQTVATSLALSASPAAWMTAAALSTPARSLAQGVIQAMFYSQLKLLAIPALLVGSAFVGGASLAASRLEGVAPNEEPSAPAAKVVEKPPASVPPGDLGPEDVLERIHNACLKYKRSMGDAELDGEEAKNEPAIMAILERHHDQVDQIVEGLRATVVRDAPSRGLLASFADFLSRERQLNFQGAGPEIQRFQEAITSLEEAYYSFRAVIEWAREDDKTAKDPMGRTRAAERYMTRIKPIVGKLHESAAKDEAARGLFNAYANYLARFVALDDHAAFKRILSADETRGRSQAADGAGSPEAKPEPPRTAAAQPATQPQTPPVTNGGFGGGGFGGGFSGPGPVEIGPAEIRQDIAGLAATIGKIDEEPSSKAVRDALDRPFTLRAESGAPLSNLLAQIKKAPLGDGKKLPVYVDPVGLENAGATLDSWVSIDLEDVPLRFSLRVALKQLGLAYCVRDGVLIISSIEGIQQELLEAEKEMIGLHPDKVIYGPNGPTLQGMGRPGGMM